MSKRTATEATASSSGAPPKKKLQTQFDSVKIGPVHSMEEMDMKVLKFQNKKLVERIDERRRAEDQLLKRIEQLEQRQTTDDAVLCIVNRYWNQLDEDVRVLLQRFDAEGADETGKTNESPAVTAFLTLLSQWDKPEIVDKLRQRVEFSKRAICKLLQAYDRMLQKNDRLWEAIKGKADDAEKDVARLEQEAASLACSIKNEPKEETDIKSEPKEDDKAIIKKEPTEEGEEIKEEPATEDIKKVIKTEPDQVKTEEKMDALEDAKRFLLNEAVKKEQEHLRTENKRLQDLVTELQQRTHEITLKNSELSDKLTASETEAAEQKNQLEELEYNLNTASHRVEKLDRHLADTMLRLKTYQEGEIKVDGGGEGVSKNKFNELVGDLEEQRELAINRLTELEKLIREHQEAKKECERLKMDLSTLPEHVIVETTEYKCLQSQFSVLYNESMQMKTQLEETRALLSQSKNNHLRQIEQMEGEELNCQKRLRTELIQLEDQLAQVRRENEMLRMEFEQTLAANEQTGPINREMRNLISSLKNHNEQLKGEILRFKRKLRETNNELAKLYSDNRRLWQKLKMLEIEHFSTLPVSKLNRGVQCSPESAPYSQLYQKDSLDTDTPDQPPRDKEDSPSKGNTPKREEAGPSGSGAAKKEEIKEKEIIEIDEVEVKEKKGRVDMDTVLRDLKAELKKSQDRERELKLLLDVYKSAPKDTRDKVQLMMCEKRVRQEVEELRSQVKKLQEAERRDRRKLADDEAVRKIKKLEESISDLQKNLQAQKQEEETLLNEMEVTGQAFEDMQEQNIRLLQQLREKDDANFKLMSERIKSNQIHKLLREEKEVLVEQVSILQSQVDAQMLVVRKLEEKEQILQNNLSTVEKELSLRQQAMELHKRKAVESAQTAADLKLHLDKYISQLKEAQNAVTDKTGALQQQTFKYKRIQEDVAILRRKVERAKKIEQASSADEVLLEEIREYKEQLTCPSCKVKKKDAVLTKCFHVFCLDCLKTRYETRQRKCPKCNAAFGANDYHRIYLE